MIYLPFVALLFGFAVSYFTGFSFEVDEDLARYTAIAVLAGLDTVLGGLRAWLSNEDKFDDTIFVSGFFVNALLASGLVVLGEKLGLETGYDNERVSVMLIAAAVVFGTRIFNNLASLRRLLIEKWRAHGQPAEPAEATANEAA